MTLLRSYVLRSYVHVRTKSLVAINVGEFGQLLPISDMMVPRYQRRFIVRVPVSTDKYYVS